MDVGNERIRNDLTPRVSRSVYQMYVISRLTYGTESLCLLAQQLDDLETFIGKIFSHPVTS